MKNSKKYLDVDFIGGEKPLTAEEQKTISTYIANNKVGTVKKQLRKIRNKRIQKKDA